MTQAGLHMGLLPSMLAMYIRGEPSMRGDGLLQAGQVGDGPHPPLQAELLGLAAARLLGLALTADLVGVVRERLQPLALLLPHELLREEVEEVGDGLARDRVEPCTQTPYGAMPPSNRRHSKVPNTVTRARR